VNAAEAKPLIDRIRIPVGQEPLQTRAHNVDEQERCGFPLYLAKAKGALDTHHEVFDSCVTELVG
jgi:hypothetical protein